MMMPIAIGSLEIKTTKKQIVLTARLKHDSIFIITHSSIFMLFFYYDTLQNQVIVTSRMHYILVKGER